MSIVGIIFSNSEINDVHELTSVRETGSIPFGGRYRLIDFPLSNLVNAGATRVGVITKSNYQSLMDHIGTGKEWDLARKSGGLILLPPFGLGDSTNSTRIEGLRGISNFIAHCTEDYAIIGDCDTVFNIDYNDVIRSHEERNADITIIYKHASKWGGSKLRSIYTDENERVVNITDGLDDGTKRYMGTMIMKRRLLQILIAQSNSTRGINSLVDLIAPRLDDIVTFAYEYKGYYAYLDSLQSYYKANMDLLNKEKRDMLFRNGDRPIYTKVKDSPPTKYEEGSKVVNSFVADGCSIMGEVENSIIFRGAVIEKGAKVKNCILLQNGYVGRDASLNCVITDKNVTISEKRVLSGAESLPFYVSKGRRV